MKRPPPPWYASTDRRRDAVLQLVAACSLGAFVGLGVVVIGNLPRIWIPFVVFVLILPFVVMIVWR